MKFTTPTLSYWDRRETERALTIHADSANVKTELDVLSMLLFVTDVYRSE